MVEDNNMVMPVSPVYGNGNNAFGGDWAWIILLLLLGWGNNGNGFGGNGGNNMYPWMNQLDATNAGFQNAQLASQLSAIQTGINNNQNALQQTGFGIQSAIMSGNSALQAQLANCCCENRLATANLQSVIASENCADRQAVSDGIRDILVNQNANTQRILDLMCSNTIDAKNDRIAELERQLSSANFNASQIAQTAQIEQFIRNNSTTPTTASAG